MLNFTHENKSTHADFVKIVVIRNEAVPSFFIIFAGEHHAAKKLCFNALIKDWILQRDSLYKVGKLKEGECPYLRPSSFITHIKTLNSELQDCNIHFNIKSGFEAKGKFGILVKGMGYVDRNIL